MYSVAASGFISARHIFLITKFIKNSLDKPLHIYYNINNQSKATRLFVLAKKSQRTPTALEVVLAVYIDGMRQSRR